MDFLQKLKHSSKVWKEKFAEELQSIQQLILVLFQFCYFSFLLGEIHIQIAELSRSGICEWTYLSEPLKKALSCDVNMLSKIGDP